MSPWAITLVQLKNKLEKMEQKKQSTNTPVTPSANHEADVVVIGAGLTGLTTAFYLTRGGKNVAMIETSDRVGGQIHSHRVGDFIFESGPNTGAISYPEVVRLFDDLKPSCELEEAHKSSKRRLIWKGHKFHELPSGPISGLRTPLFTWHDKIRILFEPWRKKGTNPNESVGDMAARRLGKSFVDYAVDPFLSGVYASDPGRLPTRLALPKLYNLEQNYGSFIRGALAKLKERKSTADRMATKGVFSARGGLSNLTNALAQSIGMDRIHTSAQNVSVMPKGKGWVVTFRAKDGIETTIACQRVVTTCPAYALPTLLPFVDKAQMAKLSNLYYAPIVQIGVGLTNHRGIKYNAFGGLVPSKEHKKVLGILFPSACFDGRAPKEGVSYTFFLGGTRHPEYVEKSDEELKKNIDDTLHDMLKYPADMHADSIQIYRHKRAIPQYELSSQERFDTIEELAAQYPTLTIAGNLWGGIGMADRIKQAVGVAKDINRG